MRSCRDPLALLDPRDLPESTERMDRMERTERTVETLRFSLPLLLSPASSALLDPLDLWDPWDPRDPLAPRDLPESPPRMEPPERWEWLVSLDLSDALAETVCEELPEHPEDSFPCLDLRDPPDLPDPRDLLDPRATLDPTDRATPDPPVLPETQEHLERKEDPDLEDLLDPLETMETRDLAHTALVSSFSLSHSWCHWVSIWERVSLCRSPNTARILKKLISMMRHMPKTTPLMCNISKDLIKNLPLYAWKRS